MAVLENRPGWKGLNGSRMCKDGKKKTNRVFTDQHRKKPLMVVYKEQVMKKREKKTRTKFKESISDR